RWAATVVRLRSDIVDGTHFEACSLKRTNCSLATRTRPLDEYVDLLHTVLLCLTCRGLRGHLGGIRCGLAGSLESHNARRRPRERCSGRVGDGDDCVVEGRFDVGLAHCDVLLVLATGLASRGLGCCH